MGGSKLWTKIVNSWLWFHLYYKHTKQHKKDLKDTYDEVVKRRDKFIKMGGSKMENKINIKNEIMCIIEEIGFLTGSKKFGVSNDDSDWDYVILFDDFKKALDKKKITLLFNDPNIEDNVPKCLHTDKKMYNRNKSSFFRSYRINDDEYEFNIIMVWDKIELEIWKQTTQMIETLPLNMVKERRNRIILFEAIKEVKRNLIKQKEF